MRGRSGTRTQRRGFSLVEIALVLAIAALLIAGAMLMYGRVVENLKVRSLGEEIPLIVSIGHSLFPYNRYSAFGAGPIVASGMLPNKYIAPYGYAQVMTPYGGMSLVVG